MAAHEDSYQQIDLLSHVVLKKIRRELVGDETIVERFQREARAAAAVHHQNVVAVYDGFEHRGDLYIAQEFVNGVDLRAILKVIWKALQISTVILQMR